MKFIELYESLSTPYKYNWKDFEYGNTFGSFKTDNNIEINFYISSSGNTQEIVFSQGKSDFNLTGTGDGFKVLATILEMIREYINKFGNKIQSLLFSSTKADNNKDTGRTKLYTRMIKKYLPKGWSSTEHLGATLTIFELRNKNYKGD